MSMRVYHFVSMFAVAALHAEPTPAQMQALVKNRPELDEIRWQDPARGAPIKVRIMSADARSLTVEKTLPSGLTTRKIPFSDLSDVHFQLTPRELALHRQPAAENVPPLRVYWELRQATMRFPGADIGATGIALAKSLRLAGDPASLDEAGRILDHIRANDPDKSRVEIARAEQLSVDFTRSLATGKLEETDKLAWKITEETDDADAMLLATAFLGDRHFTELRALEENNPRWIEDDEIRPSRDKLYHLALDFSVYPSLFLGTRVAEAAAGLKRAAEIYQFTGEVALAKGALEDLAALYPESEAAAETAPLLARFRQAEAAGNLAAEAVESKTEGESESGPDPAAAAPPPAKRYNIFGD